MITKLAVDSLVDLAASHRGGAPAGEVFLALEHCTADDLREIWSASLAHANRDDAVIVEHACASRWSDRDLPAMARAILGEPRSFVPAAETAAAALARLPHEVAWELLNQAANNTETARLVYLSVLAQSRPEQALSLLPPLQRGYHGGPDRDHVIRAAARVDASFTVSWMKEQRTGGTDARAIACELATFDPVMAMDVARWMSEENQGFEADRTVSDVIDRWALSDPGAAGAALVQWLNGTDERTPVTSWYTGRELKDTTGRVFHRWAEKDAPQALAFAMRIAPEHIRHVALNSIGIGWTKAADGLQAAESLPPDDRLAFMELLAPRLASSDPDLLRQELGTMPPPESTRAAGALHSMYQLLGETEAAAFKQEHPQWFEDVVPGFQSMDAAFAGLFSKISSSLESDERLNASLARVRRILEQHQP